VGDGEGRRSAWLGSRCREALDDHEEVVGVEAVDGWTTRYALGARCVEGDAKIAKTTHEEEDVGAQVDEAVLRWVRARKNQTTLRKSEVERRVSMPDRPSSISHPAKCDMLVHDSC